MQFDFSKKPGKQLLNRDIDCSGEPLVSLITPYYNAGKYFEQTFNCVMNQTFPYFEWIIVDDGSTSEEDIKILETFAKKESRIKVYHKDNGGIATARNMGIKHACTNIVIPLDGDDLIVPTFLECLYFGLYFNPDATWSYTDCVGFQNQEYIWRKDFSPEGMKHENVLVCTAAIRKDHFEKIGFYDESERNYNEDWCAWLRLMGKSRYPVHVKLYGFWYRRLDDGVLSKVLTDAEVAHKSRRLIDAAAATVDTSIRAIQYPRHNKVNLFSRPVLSEWNRKLYQHHNKIHVMMLIPWMAMGGASLFNLEVVRRIDKSKFEMSILTTESGESDWRQRFEEYVTDIFELPNFLDVQNFAEFVSYFIKSREIDVIYIVNSYYSYYILPWLRKEFPEIAIVDCIHADMDFWRAGGYARISRVTDCVLDKTVTTNEHSRGIMINKYGKSSKKVKTIYTGVDQEYMNPNVISCEGLKIKCGIDESRPTVLYLCRIAPEKRPFLMLEIAKEARKRIENIAFLVVGDGYQFDEFKNKIITEHLENTVYCVGRQEEIRPYYKACDILLICSIKEGIAITTFDAMQMGKPVVSGNVGSQYELVTDETGKLIPCRQSESEHFDSRDFPELEVKDYADAIEKILSDKDTYGQMSRACFRKIGDSFSMEKTIFSIERLFESLIYDKHALEKRREMAEHLATVSEIVKDYITLFTEYVGKDQESEEVWAAREWYRKLYEQQCVRGQRTESSHFLNLSEAEARLEEIYNMRTWKIIQKYRHFMDYSRTGKILCKMRNLFRDKAGESYETN
ncbi:glycosyltransferase [Desulfosporosinus sp. Sb-LF]|uniref:glycosyltransferase n=1 Tax=Desulfosporosinus sp. Sb-LF TaxID=2560027 RepID=UPI00107FC2A8|nr:glycosyltransferase [Desulfosporosinus sp. Sb-LF]TGE33793.1 glycosyltransferase [Desulfosporosinus sp. Sb-LF]